MRKFVALFTVLSLLLAGCGNQKAVSKGSPNDSMTISMNETKEESVGNEQENTKETSGVDIKTDEILETSSTLEASMDTVTNESKDEKSYEEYDIIISQDHYVYTEFSEGLAWTFLQNKGKKYLGIINENGDLIFVAGTREIYHLLGGRDLHNTIFRDGISALYTGAGYIIFNKDGIIQNCEIGNKYEKYKMLGYGAGEFLITKEEYDGFERKTKHFYSIDEWGNVLGDNIYIGGDSMTKQHLVYLEPGVFTDGVVLYDLNKGVYKRFDASLSNELDRWFRNPNSETFIQNVYYNEYPLTRAFAYYGDCWGFDLKEDVCRYTYYENNNHHYAFYDMDGNLLVDIDEDKIGMRIAGVGMYSNGYIPLRLEDANHVDYLTVVNLQGDMIYSPLRFDEYGILNLRGLSSYNGYVGVEMKRDNTDFAIVTPQGEIKYIGDDLSEMGDNAYMYGTDGCLIAGGYIFGMNHDTAYDRLYTRDGEYLDDVYMSLDGKRSIDRVHTTDATNDLSQLGNVLSYEERCSIPRLEKGFQGSSMQFDIEMAKLAAIFSMASEDITAYNIKNAYKAYGIQDVKTYNYGTQILGGGASCFGRTKISVDGDDVDLLIITCRGSTTVAEFAGDLFKGFDDMKKIPFLGHEVWDNNYDFEEKVWSAFSDYLYHYPELRSTEHLKILINGHSLGGAAASMIGARIDYGIEAGVLFNKNVSKEDVFDYTFGAIKTVTSDTNITSGYENIHNIYNYYDAFGYRGEYSWTNASSAGAKFGHTELFELDFDKDETGPGMKNHYMSTYIDALEREDIKKGFFITICD